MATKTIHLETCSGISLDKISNDIKKHLSGYYSFLDKNEKWWGADVLIQHYVVPLKPYDKQKRKILIQPVDGTILSDKTISMINMYDEIITPSVANKKTLIENGITKLIHVIPNYHDEYTTDNGYFSRTIPDSKYTFYTETTGIKRKNVENVVRYFLEEFSETDNVRLIVKINSDKSQGIKDIIKNSNKKMDVVIIDEYLNSDDLKSLMFNIDCYVCLSHMEGFCIPLLNAAYLRKDVICIDSKISGFTDYIDSTNARLVKSRFVPIDRHPESLLIYSEDSLWERPDYMDYRKALREVFGHKYKFSKVKDFSEYDVKNVMQQYKTVVDNIHKFPFGVFSMPVDDGCKHLVDNRSFNWELWFDKVIQENLSSESNVIDAGAHIGFITTKLAKHCSQGHVFSFEPHKVSYSHLVQNIELNDLKNVTSYNYAVGAETRLVNLSNSNNLFLNKVETSSVGADADTQMVCLDSFDFPKINLIKIDTEGFEIFVLEGAKNILLRDHPVLVVEIEHIQYNRIKKLLEGYSYNSFEKLHNGNNTNRDYIIKKI